MTEEEFCAMGFAAFTAIESAKARLKEAHASFARMGTMFGANEDAALPFLAKLEVAVDAVDAMFAFLEQDAPPF